MLDIAQKPDEDFDIDGYFVVPDASPLTSFSFEPKAIYLDRISTNEEHPPRFEAHRPHEPLWMSNFDFSQRKPPPTRAQKLVHFIKRVVGYKTSSKTAPRPANEGGSNAQTVSSLVAKETSNSSTIEALNPPWAYNTPFNPDNLCIDLTIPPGADGMESISRGLSNTPTIRLTTEERQALEGRLNIHLGALDRLKRYVKMLNEQIGATTDLARNYVAQASVDEPDFFYVLCQLGVSQRASRDTIKPFVAYHLYQISRIARIRIHMNISAGLGPRVPQIFQNLQANAEWEDLFAF